MTPLVEARGLAIAGRLHETALSLGDGALTCLVGPNGSGKTSLLRALAGLAGTAGHVQLDRVDPHKIEPRRRPAWLTYLPATRDIAWPLSARDLIGLGGGTAEFADLELEALYDRRIDSLSTGERSRVLLARALAPRPKLLLLDEPTANLDPLWQIRLMALIRRELAQGGRTALVAIHDLDAAQRFADRILVMNDGEIVGEGLEPTIVSEVFGIVKGDRGWEPLSPTADPQSSQ